MADKVIDKLLTRLALAAAVLLPIAHLTSLGVMEMCGFVLFATGTLLFMREAMRDPAGALGRMRAGAVAPIAGYTVFSLLSIGLMLSQADDQIEALRELKWVLYFFAFLYSFERVWNNSWRRFIPVHATTVSLMGLFALGQFVQGWEWPRPESVLAPWGHYFRVTGFFNTPQSFAGNLGMATFFLLGYGLAGSVGASRVTQKLPLHLAVSAVMGALGVVLTLTRSAWFAGATIAVLALGRFKKSWGALALVAVTCLSGLTVYSGSVFSDRLSGEVDLNIQSIEIRQELWSANWRMFSEYPILGVGPGQNVKQLENYYDNGAVEYAIIDRAHNNILEHLAGQGIFAAIFYLIFSGYFIWIAYWLSRQQSFGDFARGIGSGSLFAQIYFQALGLVDSNFFDQEVKNAVVYLWALTAAVFGRVKYGGVAERSE